MPGVAWEYFTGVLTILIVPQSGCSISVTIFLACTMRESVIDAN